MADAYPGVVRFGPMRIRIETMQTINKLVPLALMILAQPAFADRDDWRGGWGGFIAPPSVVITPPVISLPGVYLGPTPIYAAPPPLVYGPQYGGGYAPPYYYGHHHRHHHHDRDWD